jgi:hypothetical protein
MSNVTSAIDSYSWVRPAWPAPAPEAEWSILTPEQLAGELASLPPQKLAFDTETTGL